MRSLEVVSNRADLGLGGDALVAAQARRRRRPASVRVDVDGTDVTSAFAMRPSGRYEGSLSGLKLGRNTLTVTRRQRRQADRDHEPPDRRPDLRRPAGDAVRLRPERLDAAARPAARRAVQRADPRRAALPQRWPASSSPTTRPTRPAGDPDDDDRLRPHRAVHRRARHRHRGPRRSSRWRCSSTRRSRSRRGRPSSRGAASSSTRSAARAAPSTASWPPTNVLQQATQLGAGFVVATSSLNVYANNCNDVVSAEAAMMTKELVIERYGELQLHDRQRRLGGDDAAAPAGRELPGAPRRADHEPGVRGPLRPRCRARSTAAC